MVTNRQFTDFNEDERGGLAMSKVPKDGFCIAAFVVVTDEWDTRKVLMGKLNPQANWDHIGALDSKRVRRHKEKWTLPSSHLMLFESPQDASKRILKEQLEMENLELAEPVLFSDVRALKRAPDAKHWDLDFIFRGKTTPEEIPRNPKAWKELAFVDFDKAPKGQITQLHLDVIKRVN
jgi:ADP-ribose pyrophosphatase YjhB (NUDIX family)